MGKVTEEEIAKVLQGIGDLKAPGIDGFGAKFFKASWHIIKGDVIEAIMEFFEMGRTYEAFNSIVVTLIPKNENANFIKDYRTIVGCNNFYKIISKNLTSRLGKVLYGVIHHCQASFVPCQVIHNHIRLAFIFMKGYTRKGGTSRCMMQLNPQKAYDMVDWKALKCVL